MQALVRTARAGDAEALAALGLEQRSLLPVVTFLRQAALADRPAMALARAEMLRLPARIVLADARDDPADLADLAAVAALDPELLELAHRSRAYALAYPGDPAPPLPEPALQPDLEAAARQVAAAEDRMTSVRDDLDRAVSDAARADIRARYVPSARDRASADQLAHAAAEARRMLSGDAVRAAFVAARDAERQ